MVKRLKAVVENDFEFLVKNLIDEKYSKQLKKQFKTGNIRFQVSRTLGLNNELDGETNFYIKEKKVVIKIKKVQQNLKGFVGEEQ